MALSINGITFKEAWQNTGAPFCSKKSESDPLLNNISGGDSLGEAYGYLSKPTLWQRVAVKILEGDARLEDGRVFYPQEIKNLTSAERKHFVIFLAERLAGRHRGKSIKDIMPSWRERQRRALYCKVGLGEPFPSQINLRITHEDIRAAINYARTKVQPATIPPVAAHPSEPKPEPKPQPKLEPKPKPKPKLLSLCKDKYPEENWNWPKYRRDKKCR